jgi:Ca2+-binding RTX toxin-like protein
MRLVRSSLLVLLALALLVPAAAPAATVSRQGDQIRYEAASGERNHVIVSAGNNDDQIGFTENSPADLQAGPGCTSHEPTQPGFVTCPRSPVTGINVNLGNGNDGAAVFLATFFSQPAPVVVNGGPGRDEVTSSGTVTLDGLANDGPHGVDNYARVEDVANAADGVDDNFTGNDAANRLASPGGSDTFDGRGGDDVISTRDVRRDLEDSGQIPPDRVTCGTGEDAAYVDDVDVVADDCEVIIRRDNVARLTAEDDTFTAQGPGLTIFGLGGDDAIGAGGAKSVSGGSGDDRITLGSAVDITANGDTGNDRIYGLVGRDRINGGAGNDKLYGER